MNYITVEDRGFRVTVIADSVNEWGDRLTTEVWRYPRFIHSEVMTHRDFSRNAASSRAIPVKKIIDQVMNDPAMPVFWGKNQPGMQAYAELEGNDKFLARERWLKARNDAVFHATDMLAMGMHKQIVNRILEPWMWMTTIISATNWNNCYHLRRAKDAQPEFKVVADLSFEAKRQSQPKLLKEGEWHLPFVTDKDREWKTHNVKQEICLDDSYLQKLSVARCARVSYLNHDGTNPDWFKDLELHDKLIQAPHASPFEHQATPRSGRHGNFTGFFQYRKMIPNEYHAG